MRCSERLSTRYAGDCNIGITRQANWPGICCRLFALPAISAAAFSGLGLDRHLCRIVHEEAEQLAAFSNPAPAYLPGRQLAGCKEMVGLPLRPSDQFCDFGDLPNEV